MKDKFEIFINDLKPEKQKELIEFLNGENGNYDIFPLAIIYNSKEDK